MGSAERREKMKKTRAIVKKWIVCILIFMAIIIPAVVFSQKIGRTLTIILVIVSFIPLAAAGMPFFGKRDRDVIQEEYEEAQRLEEYKRREEWKNKTL